MLAAWYDRQGPASEVLQIGDLPDPQPAPTARSTPRPTWRSPQTKQTWQTMLIPPN
jgi:hypothetical protein